MLFLPTITRNLHVGHSLWMYSTEFQKILTKNTFTRSRCYDPEKFQNVQQVEFKRGGACSGKLWNICGKFNTEKWNTDQRACTLRVLHAGTAELYWKCVCVCGGGGGGGGWKHFFSVTLYNFQKGVGAESPKNGMFASSGLKNFNIIFASTVRDGLDSPFVEVPTCIRHIILKMPRLQF